MSVVCMPYPIIAGPTASGKTATAVKLAKQLGGEVVSADSMQIYDEVSIGTARPTAEEMEGAPHHLLGILPLQEKYSVARYLADANRAFKQIFASGRTPVMCGGTCLYIQSFMENRQLLEQQPDPALRRKFAEVAEEQGIDVLFQHLQQVDPESASKLHRNDQHRIIRALEVYHTTGMTIGDQDRLSHAVPSPYAPCLFVLDFRDRQALYQRINRRVDVMLENGLLDEARRILQTNRDATVTQAIGYKEFEAYFDGVLSLEEAAEHLKQQTRRYAKRQLSWFHRMQGVHTLWVDESSGAEDLAQQAYRLFETFRTGGST